METRHFTKILCKGRSIKDVHTLGGGGGRRGGRAGKSGKMRTVGRWEEGQAKVEKCGQGEGGGSGYPNVDVHLEKV